MREERREERGERREKKGREGEKERKSGTCCQRVITLRGQNLVSCGVDGGRGCARCRGAVAVWCDTLKNPRASVQNVSVRPSKTSPCVRSKRPRLYRHHGHMLKN